MKRILFLALLLVAIAGATHAQGAGDTSQEQGRVYDENLRPPPGCAEIAGVHTMTVVGGRDHVIEPGRVFGYDAYDFDLPACTQVDVTFVNEDDVRHMWMVHDVWPNGTFLLEVDGPGRVSGSFVLPAEPTTLLVHCGLPSHQQMGMKAQIRVAGGAGDLPNIQGLAGIPEAPIDAPIEYLAGVAGVLVALGGIFWWQTRP